MRIVGIDPGLEGAAALWAGVAAVQAAELPTTGEGPKRRIDAAELVRLLLRWRPEHVFIERAGAMPKQGVASVFRYGRAVGAIEAAPALLGIPVTMVEPAVWKRALGLLGQGKEDSRQRALQLVPAAASFLRLKKDHGKAEAILIAIYGARSLGVPIRGFQSQAGRAIIPA